MRISDWSSDVCSSDLSHIEARCATFRTSTGAVDPETVAITNTRPCASTMPKHHSRSYGTYTVWASGKSAALAPGAAAHQDTTMPERSEEHTSELQSLMRISYAVFCLKKKKQITSRILIFLSMTHDLLYVLYMYP